MQATMWRQAIGWLTALGLVAWCGAVMACVDHEYVDDSPPAARILASWDPIACGEDAPRVVVELEDPDGVAIASSATCRVGRLTLDAPRWGTYRGRTYSWVLGEPIRSVTPVTLTVDATVVHWQLATPG